jgi:hypothetical protein
MTPNRIHGVDTLTEKLNKNGGCSVNLSTPSIMKSALDSLIEELEAEFSTISAPPKVPLSGHVRSVEPQHAPNARPATCYELEPGVWIRRPWAGCTTVKPEARGEPRKVAVTCWHCGGSGRCGCSSCGVMWPQVTWAAGECLACRAGVRVQ